MLRWLAFAFLFLAAAATPAAAKVLSADSLAIAHDLIAPYRGGVAQSADADPSAVTQALAILKKGEAA